MQDLTILYLTASQLPKQFAEYQRNILKEAIGDYPLISISRKPLNFGKNLIDSEPKNISNIYFQMLRAAKIAKTDYVAMAEDDVLYSKEHYNFYRPEKDVFAYNQSRWALFNWGKPTYNWRDRRSNSSLIAPRLLMIEALEERFKKYPNGTLPENTGELGRWRIEKRLGLTLRKSIVVYSNTSIIQINHEQGTEKRQVNHKKRMGPLRAYDIFYWGKAIDVISNYK